MLNHRSNQNLMDTLTLTNQENLPLDLLKEVFHYDPETGVFTWKVSKSNSVKVGAIAGHIDRGYRRIQINGTLYAAHRLAWLYFYGEWPPDQIDHINHNRADNRIKNLRLSTGQENSKNRSLSKNSVSGFNGVTWVKRDSKWRAEIMVDGKAKYLGLFEDINDAITVREEANIEYGFHENHGNNK